MKRRGQKVKTRRERGMELLELALSLPLMLLIVAGSIDFATAWRTRQVLANAAREGARLGSSQPMLDLNTTSPETIQAICQDVADYLAKEDVSTTFMNGTNASPAAGCATSTAIPDTSSMLDDPVPLGWTYYSSGTYGLKITRTFLVTVSSGGGSGSVSATQVSLIFPFSWPFGFNRVANLVNRGNGTSYPATVPLSVSSTMANTE